MNMRARYKIIHDEEHDSVMILDSETGAIQHPICWQDLVAFYNYLTGLGRLDEAQKLLAESMAGKKPITKMFECVSGSIQASRFFR